jgi:hypothetical protein
MGITFTSGNAYSKCAVLGKEYWNLIFVVHWKRLLSNWAYYFKHIFLNSLCFRIKCKYKYTTIYIKCQIVAVIWNVFLPKKTLKKILLFSRFWYIIKISIIK